MSACHRSKDLVTAFVSKLDDSSALFAALLCPQRRFRLHCMCVLGRGLYEPVDSVTWGSGLGSYASTAPIVKHVLL